MNSCLDRSEERINYTWWNEEIYNSLSKWGKKAYEIAAHLHDGVKRKDGSWYLEHINRSLTFYRNSNALFGTKFDLQWMERNIALHDCIEDHDDGITAIEQSFGDKVLIKTLWMSELNERVRSNFKQFINNLGDKKKEKYKLFISLIEIIENDNPESSTTLEKLRALLPEWKWTNALWFLFRWKYEREESPRKKEDIFAEWIFQGMLMNMPEDCFLAKTCERYDNLSDRTWLKNQEGWRSYEKTLRTTNTTYFPRLKNWEYLLLNDLLQEESGRGRVEMSGYIPQVNRALDSKETVSSPASSLSS